MILIPFSSIFVVVVVVFFTYLVTKSLFRRSANASPPSPPKIPILGNLHQVGLPPYRSLHSLSQRYGPLMLLHFGSKPVLVASSMEAAREIMKTHDLLFASRPKLSVADKLMYNSRGMSLAPYGEYWRQMRSICVLQLLSNKRVSSFRGDREEEVVLFIQNIKNLSNSSVPVNLSEMFASLTRDVICKVAFGKKYTTGDDNSNTVNFKGLLNDLMDLLGTFGIGEFIPWLSWVNHVNGFNRRAEKTAKEFDQFLDGVVQEHVVNMEKRSKLSDEGIVLKEEAIDLVDLLLQLQEENSGDFSLDTESIKALLLDMLVGGTDTSSTVLEWAMTELIRHPRVMKILQNEVMQASPNHDLIITETDLNKMPYLKMVVKETLRFHPPFPLSTPRESTQDVKVMGYHIPAKTLVFVNIWSLARNPTYWNRPEEFLPERFLNSTVDMKGHDFEFIPFGSGRRACPGTQFGLAIVEILLANLVKMFDWSLPDEGEGEELDIAEGMGFAIHRKNPLVAIASPTSHYST